MQVNWTTLELEKQWFLAEGERQALLPGKSQGQRLAIAALLKFYQIAGRFPENLREAPEVALHYLHPLLELDACVEPGSVYHLPSRTYERHRAEIRRFLSIRKADSSDQERAKQWLIHDVITGEQTDSEFMPIRLTQEDTTNSVAGCPIYFHAGGGYGSQQSPAPRSGRTA